MEPPFRPTVDLADANGPSAATVATAAFADFYRREHEGQVRRAWLLLGDEAAAHDVVADAFLAVLRRWTVVDQPGPYLNRCVLNGCRDRARRAAREEPVAATADRPDGGADPVDGMAELLLALPFRQRAALVLRFYGGCSEADIAEHLGCRPGTVGSLIHRGLKALASKLPTEEAP